MIPEQALTAELCDNCGIPIKLVNRQLGPTYVHPTGSELCGEAGTPATTKAVPASPPWPELVQP